MEHPVGHGWICHLIPVLSGGVERLVGVLPKVFLAADNACEEEQAQEDACECDFDFCLVEGFLMKPHN